jgi:hypothetical protein
MLEGDIREARDRAKHDDLTGPGGTWVGGAGSDAGIVRVSHFFSDGGFMHRLALVSLVVATSLSHAADLPPLATGGQLRKALAGNTVHGSMDSSGRYAEFYAKDGTVRGADYRATWSIEGDSMCWVYEGQPKDCWRAAVQGKQVKWIKDGKAQGAGTIVKGNVNGF